jgi:signal peptidase II
MKEAIGKRLKWLRPLLIVLLVMANIGCDQATKTIARARLVDKGTVFVVDSFFVLRYVENPGAFLSLGVGLPRPLRALAFIAFPLLALVIMTAYIMRAKNREWMTLAAFAFIVGGGIGNLIDRLFRDGRVSDFMNLGIGQYRIGIFNFADLSIMIGCVLLLVSPGVLRKSSAA